MELRKSAVQSFRASFSRTKTISSELSSIMQTQVDSLISIDNIMSNNFFSSKKQNEKHIITSENLNKSEQVLNTEKLFDVALPEKIQDYLSESRLLLRDLDIPKSQVHNALAAQTQQSQDKNKNLKKKIHKKKKPENAPQIYNPYTADQNLANYDQPDQNYQGDFNNEMALESIPNNYDPIKSVKQSMAYDP